MVIAMVDDDFSTEVYISLRSYSNIPTHLYNCIVVSFQENNKHMIKT